MMIGDVVLNGHVRLGVLANGDSVSEIAERIFLQPPCTCQRDVDARIGDFVDALAKAGVKTERGTTVFDAVCVVKICGWTFDCGGSKP